MAAAAMELFLTSLHGRRRGAPPARPIAYSSMSLSFENPLARRLHLPGNR
jgi:hypothetical protein